MTVTSIRRAPIEHVKHTIQYEHRASIDHVQPRVTTVNMHGQSLHVVTKYPSTLHENILIYLQLREIKIPKSGTGQPALTNNNHIPTNSFSHSIFRNIHWTKKGNISPSRSVENKEASVNI